MIPKKLTVHCTASRQGVYLTAAQIRKFHTDPKPKGMGWSDIGYHAIIRTDGTIEQGRADTVTGAHVGGFNTGNLGVALVGGLDHNGKAFNTFNYLQMNALYAYILEKCEKYNIPLDSVCGHRDYSPDLNKDGKITSNEFIKECPCFDVREWLSARLEADRIRTFNEGV
jgi:N-acetyl-anhydromuramyl-L-alanine amidase AmpD